MSTVPENEFDLEKLFLPSWAQEPSAAKYAHYEGESARPERRGDQRGPRGPRRPGGPGGPGGRRDDNRPRSDRRGPGPEGQRGQADRGRYDNRRGEPRERREPPPPVVEVATSFLPDDKGVDSLARQIKMSGRAYPLFDIAQMILQKPERHSVVFNVRKNAEGKPIQPLFVCALDDTLWLSQDEAVSHVLRKHFGTFYQMERTPAEPPKGKYTFVAQCGFSGAILGPPNYHDYQNQVRKLHSERFSRMPFEAYKARVRIVRDEEVVKKWIDDQSWKTEYICLNQPEPLRLANMEAVEKHFREIHMPVIIKEVETHTLTGVAARSLRSPELTRLVRTAWEDQRRFPLQTATVLSQQFATHGLQFFKVNKTVTHVSVARPHFLDLAAAPVSEGIRRIVEFINAHLKSNRKQLVEALAPTPPVVSIPVPAPAPAEAAPAMAPAEGAPVPAPAAAPVAAALAPTPEQTAVVADLHWLIHQGHVIEFANGILENAKKPLPKPPRPELKPAQKSAADAGATPETTGSATPISEAGAPAAPAESAGQPAPSEPSASVESTPVQPAPADAAPEPVPVPATSPSVPAAEEPPAEPSAKAGETAV